MENTKISKHAELFVSKIKKLNDEDRRVLLEYLDFTAEEIEEMLDYLKTH